jgi:hypothetical protein
MRKQEMLPENWALGFTIAGLSTVLLLLAISWLLWQIPYPVQLGEYSVHLKHWLALRLHSVVPFLGSMARDYQVYFLKIEPTMSPHWLTGRFDLAASLALLCGAGMGYLAGKPLSAITHIVGRQLWRDKGANRRLTRQSRQECQVSDEGLSLHTDFQWKLSIDRESRHFLMLGSIGGGKTAIIAPLVKAAQARGDRLVIYDNKGDFTSWLPNFVFFAPWDSRSNAWDIGRDCRNAQDARELAARLIPEGTDPLWHTAARQVLTAILITLQAEHGTTWNWLTFYELVCLSREELLAMVQAYLPEARHVVDAPGKTAQSILVNFGAHMTLVADLAKAWGNHPPEKRFSIIDWLDNANSKRRVLVLQGSGKYAELAKSYIQSAITLMAGHINSPDFPESRTCRLWFILDEFPQLGKLEQVAPLLEIGRSKGIRVVLGAQDMAQIKFLYGEHTANSWASMIGTQIIVRINPGETANFLAKDVIGYRTIDRIVLHDGKRQAPLRENVLVMEPAELSSDLGPNTTGVHALLMGYGDAFILHWPFTPLTQRRKPSVPAAWLETVRSDPAIPKTSTSVPEPVLATTPASNNSVTKGEPATRSRLLLRQASAHIVEMAHSGTPITDAAEPVAAMKTVATGGNHEAR